MEHGIHEQQLGYPQFLHKTEDQVSVRDLLETFGKCCYLMSTDFLIEINIHIMSSDVFLTCVNAVKSWNGEW